MESNLAVSIYVRSSIKFLHFVPFHQQIWPPRAILVSDWLLFKKIFSSETAWQREPNLAGSIYVRSSIKLLHLVPFGLQTWPPRLILFSDWLMFKKSGAKLGIDGPWVCPFQNCVRQPHPPFKMAAVF